MSKRFQVNPPQDIGEFNIPIIARVYDFYKTLYSSLLTFSKAHRYYLGLRLDSLTIEIFELFIEAGTSKGQQKVIILEQSSIKLDILKIMIRLAKDVRCIDDKKYLDLQIQLQEVGKMLGGWLRSAKQNLPEF
ncbi:four helix bundle protein [Candidatus Microgenomates bacterium]|nr:four helix bundle protein [Candidatus Microgenomates bacterium]